VSSAIFLRDWAGDNPVRTFVIFGIVPNCSARFEPIEQIPVEAMTTDGIFPSLLVAQSNSIVRKERR
jgi:hypothetical protein